MEATVRVATAGRLTAIGAVVGVAAAMVVVPPAAVAAPNQSAIVSANPADFTPNVKNGSVKAIAQVGNTIVLGGKFTTVTNASGSLSYSRTNLVAFDAATGVISTTFRPVPNGNVEALAASPDGQSVYVAGAFTSIDGVVANRVARLNVATGAQLSAFAPGRINKSVSDMKLAGDRLYIGGAFTTVAGQARAAMATLNPTNGALTNALNLPFTGVNNAGTTNVSKFEVTPDGSRLIAIGNFASVAGQPRSQIAMLDTSGPTATVADWSTDRYPNVCASVFNTYMRDVDFSPNGDYFIVSTTGAYGGTGTLCDTITRWETGATGGGQNPTWTNFTGGDTTYAVTATGTAVYAGGHMRWVNNPYAGDAPGPGAVPREGIVALDPVTGLPFTWNPGRARGVGVFDMLATNQGLWVGSDTGRIGGEPRQRIALMPLATGNTVAPPTAPTLPGTVAQLGRLGNATDPSVLYRVNAGGPLLLSVDDGPDWEADNTWSSPYRNEGSNWVDAWNQSVTSDSGLPNTDGDRVPTAIFDSERWDPGDDNEMQWNFPVTAGTPLTLRLYFANQCGCTAGVGGRVFDVSVDGVTKLSNFDMVALKGDRVGFLESFDLTADNDGLDIDFTHIVENPLINGIEVIDRSVPAGTGQNPTADQVDRTPLAADGTVGTTTTSAGTEQWSRARGAFVANNVLYTPWQDGSLRARTVNGNGTLGTPRTVNLYGSTFGTDTSNITSITYDPASSRIYYTLAGRDRLFWRWFLPQSEIVGSERFDVDAGALSGYAVRGMFLDGGTLYFADRSSGDLLKVDFTGGVVGSSATVVDATRDWAAPGMTLLD
jgi:hypothetical protein